MVGLTYGGAQILGKLIVKNMHSGATDRYLIMDYVRDGDIQGRSFVFLKAHCPCILPSDILRLQEKGDKDMNQE